MSTEDLAYGWCELEAALPGYQRAEDMYRGRIREVFSNERIRRLLEDQARDYRFNLIKTPVNVRSARCEISSVKVPNDDASTAKVAEVWKANGMAVYYPTLIRDTFTYGDSYLMAWLVEETPDELTDDQLVAAKVELTTKNPKNTRVLYDRENERQKWFAIHRWPAATGDAAVRDKRWRAELYYADRIERYVSIHGQNLDKASGWEEYEDDESGELAIESHDFGEVPIFHHRTDVPYGRPVHVDGYGAQNAITKMLVTLLTTTDSQGFPQRYGLLDKDAVLDQQNDSPQWTDDADAATFEQDGLDGQGGQGSEVRSGPGTMQTLTGMTEVGQFMAADPSVFLEPTSTFMRIMAQVTNTPLHYFDPSGDVPSGESLKVAEAPLVKDIEWLQLLQQGAVEEEWTFVLRLLGVTVSDVDVRWASVQSATGLGDWQIVQAKIDAGVPVDQALMETGYEPEQVAAWLDADAEANTLADRVALLAEIGQAIQAMSAGIEAGVVDAAQAQAAISLVLGQVQRSGQGTEGA